MPGEGAGPLAQRGLQGISRLGAARRSTVAIPPTSHLALARFAYALRQLPQGRPQGVECARKRSVVKGFSAIAVHSNGSIRRR